MSLRQENPFHQYTQTEITPEINSIFKYYSVENEINFVATQLRQGVNPISVSKYIDNSVHRFLGEFIGQVKIDKIDYEMKNGQIYFDGVFEPISQIYKERGQIKGENSREFAEAVGFEKIEKKFDSDESNIAFWISPPSIGEEGFGNYGFLFVLVKDARGYIDEYILRYQGENAQLEKSWQKYNELISLHPVINFSEQPVDDFSVHGFLKDPLFAKTDNPVRFLADIGYKDLSEFRKFHQKLDQEVLFRSWLDEYIETILYAVQETDIFSKKHLIDQAERSLAGIYNLAQDIKNNQLITQVNKIIRQPDFSDLQIAMMMRQNYIQKYAVVVGGGSCPADTSNIKSPFQNSWQSILEDNGILDHKSATNLTSSNQNETDTFSCPNCNQPIEKGKGITTCPHCGMTKEKYAERTRQNCD